MEADTTTHATRPGRSKAVRGFLAMLVVGIWIPLLATVPQVLGGMLWRRVGFPTDLPLRHVTQVVLNTFAVLAFVLLTGRGRMLLPARPKRPGLLLLFLPLMFVNMSRGPLVEAGCIFFFVVAVDSILIGFWEEFLFRGLIQERLRVLGPRLSLLVTAILFGLIHCNEGVIPVLIAIGIGLSFCVARGSIGMGALVLVHAMIDFMSAVHLKRWEHQFTLGASLVAAYFLVSLLVLWRRPPAEPQPELREGPRPAA